MKKLTPMMKQYYAIKKEHKHALVMFRMGDFYELFDEDAKVAAGILGITLTARNKGKENEMPMCGVPHHSAESYIAKLTRAGKHVAICEQLTEAGKGIVERGVVRTITPGTTLSDDVLDSRANNFLVSIIGSSDKDDAPSEFFAISVCDITTGEFKVTQLERKKLKEEIARLNPVEIVLEENSPIAELVYSEEINISYFSTYKEFNEVLKEHFGVNSLEGFGIEGDTLKIKASGLLLEYIKDTQQDDLKHIQSLQSYSVSDCMVLDKTTIANLELVTTLREGEYKGSLLHVIDKTMTSMGARLLKNHLLHPCTKKDHIENRLSSVEELYNSSLLLTELRDLLSEINDIERIFAKISLNSCSPRDIDSLKNSLKVIPQVKQKLLSSSLNSNLLKKCANELSEHAELIELIEESLLEELPLTLKDGGVMSDNVSAELKELREVSRNAKTLLKELASRESERTGINSLKVKFNNVFGYYLEVSNANKHLVPDDYIRKQTLVNAERYITEELKVLEEKILNASEKIVQLEKEFFEKLRGEVVSHVKEIKNSAFNIALLDVIASHAYLAKEKAYTRPELIDGDSHIIDIKDGRHPVIENLTYENSFVPNDTHVDSNENFVKLITGPNMAGKSTYLRQVALITLLAHVGCFVPAGSAKISLTDRIFTRVGAQDNLAKGQSTFMVEMQEAANILNNATSKSLIILDEIGRGTSTYDGVSIAWSILEYVHDTLKASTLFATHYHELIAVADSLNHACNWSVQVAEKTDENGEKSVYFLHKVKPGGVSRSYGIEVAKLAGLPKEIIKKATHILNDLEEGVVEKGIKSSLSKRAVLENQQGLFDSRVETKEVVPPHLERMQRALDEIDPMNVTPMQALQKLEELKKIKED